MHCEDRNLGQSNGHITHRWKVIQNLKLKAEGQNNFCMREQNLKENQTHYPLGTSKLEI